MSTEQRDKAATVYVAPIENFDECVKAEHDFKQGWDAHAATMPDREALAAEMKNLNWEQLGSDGFATGIADAVLALLNKEGEE